MKSYWIPLIFLILFSTACTNKDNRNLPTALSGADELEKGQGQIVEETDKGVVVEDEWTLPIYTKGPAETRFDRELKRMTSRFPLQGQSEDMVKALQHHLALGASVNDPHTESYQTSLNKLQQKENEVAVINAVASEYTARKEEDYSSRMLLVGLLAELKNSKAKFFFQRIINAEIPPEQSKDTHHYSTRAEEVKIKLSALHGLELLKEQALLKEITVKHENRGVKTEAILAFMDIHPKGKENAKAELKKVLPQEDYALMEIVRIGANDIELMRKYVNVKREEE